ncbi:GMC oxidoreductase [Roseomonas elaeocarpi]|uniref:GMC oxidoreductase n=1 Tax=Roseomonas elaeocarpi TaxID=907779 RepID=A0ABV6JLP8_9PROT
MFVDLEGVESGTVVEADVVIIGAGAAGIAMARRLARTPLRVVLLESGGLKPNAAAQALNEGTNLGLPYYPLTQSRSRGFGGTTATWSGRNIPLDPVDFTRRAWVPHSGWPVSYDTMLPFFHEASAVMNVGQGSYGALWDEVGVPDPALDPASFVVRFWRIRAERLGERYRDELQRSHSVTVLLGGTATELLASGDGRTVSGARVRTLGGRSFELRARHFVLATGGIENARLLLASDARERGGIGNGQGLVGRFFMEHPKCRTATLQATDPYRMLEVWRQHYPRSGPRLWPSIVSTPEVQARHGILNSSLAIYFRSLPGVTEAASRIGTAIKQRRRPAMGDLLALAPVLHEVPANLVRRFVRRRSFIVRPTALYVLTRGEQAPNPDSRVVLSTERDALGQRRADLDWRLSSLDKHSAKVMTELLGSEFTRLGLGKVAPDGWLLDGTADWPLEDTEGDHHTILQGGHHHIGTTRMGDNPRTAVVDADCRVFGKENLYVAGSSVFPTSGWANPTLTIVALALRLADHLAVQAVAAPMPVADAA